MDVKEATRNFVPGTPEQLLELQTIVATIETFQKHLAQLSSSGSTIDLKKVLRFDNETIVVTCSSSHKTIREKFCALFKL